MNGVNILMHTHMHAFNSYMHTRKYTVDMHTHVHTNMYTDKNEHLLMNLNEYIYICI